MSRSTKSWFFWGVIVAFMPGVIPILLLPLWWLAGCEYYRAAVFCRNAVWYSSIVANINELGWLMIVSLPVGLILVVVGFFKMRAEFRSRASASNPAASLETDHPDPLHEPKRGA